MGRRLLGFVDVTIIRRAPGSRGVDGIWQEGAESTLIVKGSIQPLSGKELRQLTEGRRMGGRLKLYTKAELKTVNQDTAQNADLIEYNGRRYLVEDLLFYSPGIGRSTLNHRKYLLARSESNLER